jgi:hypothetical protein
LGILNSYIIVVNALAALSEFPVLVCLVLKLAVGRAFWHFGWFWAYFFVFGRLLVGSTNPPTCDE